MPLRRGASVSENISELHTGNTYARTKRKFGKRRADKQAVAIALKEKRESGRRKERFPKKDKYGFY